MIETTEQADQAAAELAKFAKENPSWRASMPNRTIAITALEYAADILESLDN